MFDIASCKLNQAQTWMIVLGVWQLFSWLMPILFWIYRKVTGRRFPEVF